MVETIFTLVVVEIRWTNRLLAIDVIDNRPPIKT